MPHKWYEDLKNVFELAEFVVESEQIDSAKELLEYFRHPEKYTEVWNLYQTEIHGKISGKTSGIRMSNSDIKIPFPVMMALAEKNSK